MSELSYIILREQVFKDQLQFEPENENATQKNKVKKRKKKSKEKLEKNHQPLLPFTLKFSRKKVAWLKNNHQRPEEHLVIMLCSGGQDIFLVLQYLLPLNIGDETCIPQFD